MIATANAKSIEEDVYKRQLLVFLCLDCRKRIF